MFYGPFAAEFTAPLRWLGSQGPTTRHNEPLIGRVAHYAGQGGGEGWKRRGLTRQMDLLVYGERERERETANW